jgi:hypothetical protein
MKEPLCTKDAASDALAIDVDVAFVVHFPGDASSGVEAMPPSVRGPVLSMPVDAGTQAAVLANMGVRTQVNATVVDGVPFPLIALQAGDRAMACAFEPADELGRQVFGAARQRGWLPVCLNSGAQAIVVRVDWEEHASDLYERMGACTALSVDAYAVGINAAIAGARQLFLSQAPHMQPRHLAMRLLASPRRMDQTIEAAMVTGVSLRRH